jgi:hypothetical protein
MPAVPEQALLPLPSLAFPARKPSHMQALGYDDEGRVLNYVGVATPTPADITAAATHMVTFIDMGGHEKYLKTTLYGMTCLLPGKARPRQGSAATPGAVQCSVHVVVAWCGVVWGEGRACCGTVPQANTAWHDTAAVGAAALLKPPSTPHDASLCHVGSDSSTSTNLQQSTCQP